MARSKKQEELEQQVGELTIDLQRTRADFENYRKRVEQEKDMAKASGRANATMKLLPLIDDIDRALQHLPNHLKDDTWAKSVVNLSKSLEKSLAGLGVEKIDAKAGTHFSPDLHDAVQFDEDAIGEHEIIESELRTGYRIDGIVMQPSMVKVTRR